MIKFTQGNITSIEKRVTKDIVVKAPAPNKLKEILIGGGLVMIGVAYLTYTAFRNGSRAFDEAETRTLEELGLLE